MSEHNRKWLFFPALGIGVLIAFVLVKQGAQPGKIPLQEQASTVRVIKVPSANVIPRYLGTGTVAPSQIWNGVIQVSGRVMFVHSNLKKGAVIQADEVLVKIETGDYELAIAQADASIEGIRAQITEIAVKQSNGRAALKIEDDALRIANVELERKRKLLGTGTVSHTDFDQEERKTLTQKQSVLIQQNALNLYPVEQQRLQAELASLESQRASANLNLDRTTLRMPFTGRIAESNIERLQFVREGEVLLVADGLAKAEISVQVPMNNMSELLRSDTVLNIADATSANIGARLGLGDARVLLKNKTLAMEWKGRVARISDTLNPKTRTIGVIVEVDAPYANVQPGIRPPLVKGLFVNVELRGRARPDSLVIPRNALHGNTVYWVKSDSRLELRKVEVAMSGTEFAIIRSGLNVGDQIVVSDLQPAIAGMLLKTVDDPIALQQVLAESSGEVQSQ
jgi:multidrug efflux system membrane fusion protein